MGDQCGQTLRRASLTSSSLDSERPWIGSSTEQTYLPGVRTSSCNYWRGEPISCHTTLALHLTEQNPRDLKAHKTHVRVTLTIVTSHLSDQKMHLPLSGQFTPTCVLLRKIPISAKVGTASKPITYLFYWLRIDSRANSKEQIDILECLSFLGLSSLRLRGLALKISPSLKLEFEVLARGPNGSQSATSPRDWFRPLVLGREPQSCGVLNLS
ncbi:hypothetical protein RRG08_032290 [Elysia crispata]|uniref:Uncharacterized protein n=1 Tax=Elysia crispata TaxID=231223 RepID=A0AAE1ARL6_9GAST|nr:hypothetical protein RRG08_032290 [Elysia crispata]